MNPRSPFDTLSVLIASAALFLTPLAHSGAVSDPFGIPKDIVVLAGAHLLLLSAILEALWRSPRPRWRALALYLTAGFLLCCAVAAVRSPNRALALSGLTEVTALAIIAWSVARSAREPRDVSWMLRATLASATLVAAGTIVQALRPGFSLTIAGLSVVPPAPAGATLGDPGLAAQFLILALPLGLGAASLSSGPVRLLCGGALGVVLAALVLTSGPEGWIVGAGVTALLALTGAARTARAGGGLSSLLPDAGGESLRTTIVGATALILILTLSHAPGVASADRPATPLRHVALLAPTTGDPVADRAAAVRGSQALLALHPLGVGPSFWRHAFLEVAWARVESSPFDLGHQAIHAGNSFIELAAETGIGGGVLFAALFLLLVVQAGRTAFLDPGPWGTVGLASLNALLGAGLMAFYGSPFQETSPALLFWMAAGATQAGWLHARLPATARRLFIAELPPGPAGWRRRLPAWAALLLWVPLAGGACLWMASRLEAGRRTLVAQGLISGGELRGATEVLDVETVRRSPDHLPHLLLADACLRSGANQQAVDAFTSALMRSPWFPAAYLGRAAAWKELGRYDRADEDLRAALQVWPDAPEILLRRAVLDARWGRLEASLEGYRRLSQVSPKMADPWCGMGDLYLRLGNIDAAMEAYMTCVSKNPGFPGVNLGLGETYEKKGLDEMALGYYKRGAIADEKSVAARLKLANLYDLMGQHCHAKEALLAARDLEPDAVRRSTIIELVDKVDPACRREQQKKK